MAYEKACKLLDEGWSPKFMVVVARKNHYGKFFQTGSHSVLSELRHSEGPLQMKGNAKLIRVELRELGHSTHYVMVFAT
ncbi:hypothetical protein ACFX1S_046116 [Malus domestica]